jgi:hypothetical protein
MLLDGWVGSRQRGRHRGGVLVLDEACWPSFGAKSQCRTGIGQWDAAPNSTTVAGLRSEKDEPHGGRPEHDRAGNEGVDHVVSQMRPPSSTATPTSAVPLRSRTRFVVGNNARSTTRRQLLRARAVKPIRLESSSLNPVGDHVSDVQATCASTLGAPGSKSVGRVVRLAPYLHPRRTSSEKCRLTPSLPAPPADAFASFWPRTIPRCEGW